MHCLLVAFSLLPVYNDFQLYLYIFTYPDKEETTQEIKEASCGLSPTGTCPYKDL